MQVFDFTDGKKGSWVGETEVANSTGGWFVEKNGSTFKVELANSRNVKPVAGGKAGIKWSWSTHATQSIGNKDHAIKAEDFGVGAICFCTGEYAIFGTYGHPEAETEWWWYVIGTAEWNREACKSGILKATKQA